MRDKSDRRHFRDDKELGEELGKRIVERMRQEDEAPLVVCVIGQTGVGKSSLLNALFKSDFAVNHVKPQTKSPEKVVFDAPTGKKIAFFDMPGIGESAEADAKYIELYAEIIRKSDIALWAFHCDSRSVAFDRAGLDRVLDVGCASIADKKEFLSRIIVILTKADQICPKPWTFAVQKSERQMFGIRISDRAVGSFVPSDETSRLLKEKEDYYFENFLRPYGSYITVRTYNDTEFENHDEFFSCNEDHVRHQGLVDAERERELSSKYPAHAGIFQRLHRSSSVVSCSSTYRYNLGRLMASVLSRTEVSAAGRISASLDFDAWSTLDLRKALTFANFRVFDVASRRWITDFGSEGR